MSNKCKICNRKLKNWKSIQRGIGPTCERRYLDKIYRNTNNNRGFITKERRNQTRWMIVEKDR